MAQIPSSPDLYHYQRFHEEHLRALLVDRKLYFSSPAAFNDPWDCQPHFDTRQVDDAAYRARMANHFEEILQRRCSTMTVEQQRQRIETLRKEPRAALEELLRQSSGMQQAIYEQWRVYCLTPHIDSELMWSHYADGHRGLAMMFKAESPFVQGHASRVNYHEFYPPFDFIDAGPEDVLLAKSRAWSYEDEYRVIALERDHAPQGTPLLKTANGLTDPPADTLCSIVLGALASEEAEKTVLSLVAESGLPLIIQRAVRAPNRYGLTFRRIL